jgi:hypothetical protein
MPAGKESGSKKNENPHLMRIRLNIVIGQRGIGGKKAT